MLIACSLFHSAVDTPLAECLFAMLLQCTNARTKWSTVVLRALNLNVAHNRRSSFACSLLNRSTSCLVVVASRNASGALWDCAKLATNPLAAGKYLLGYVMGICSFRLYPMRSLMGGTTRRVAGPAVPMTTDQSSAGFSCAAQRMYRIGVRQK